ncbi:MAG: hypothetical protein L0Y73_02755, partial [Candidatus Aminicenantes bacterium]|nr:hypothetical protein [Candidatus Aminicenantes bacterium]
GTSITNSFSYRVSEKECYKKIRISAVIDAAAAESNYAYQAGVDIDLLSGQVPLAAFPVLINKKIDSPVDAFLEENKITSKDGKKIIVAELEAIFDIAGYLKENLGIDKARLLSWEAIREAFGFEVSPEPIADGIYILCDEDTVKLIFVQGDVERIIFSAGDDFQEIVIRKNGADYLLSYAPGEHYFQCWDGSIPVYSFFKEKIVVNGNAWSIEQSGEGAFLPDSNIVLHVSRLAIIKTSLVTRDIDLKTIDLSHLTLLSGSKGMPGQDNTDSGVVIDINEEAAVQANIIVDGKVTNNSAKLNLSGSLYARELENKGALENTHLESKFDADRYFAVKDFKYISDFLINFFEEVYDEVR